MLPSFPRTGAMNLLRGWLEPTPATPIPGRLNLTKPATESSELTCILPELRFPRPSVENVNVPRGGNEKSIRLLAEDPEIPTVIGRPALSKKAAWPDTASVVEGLHSTTSEITPSPLANCAA